MPTHDLKPDGGYPPRSLSEQLRLLEQQLSRLSDAGPVQIMRPTRQPMSLGRPVGLAPPVRVPVLGVPERHTDEEEAREPTVLARRGPFRRRAIIGGVSLLLLASTAVVPPLLWHPSRPSETVMQAPPALVSLRTEQFAHSARELGQARPVHPAPAESPSSEPMTLQPAVTPPPAIAPETSQDTDESHARAPGRPMTTLTVAESELPRLSLPMLVSGGGPAWAGSAVVIDGLPADARVSHGLKIAPDTWTVGIADVRHAVLSLPRTTPDRLELSVRVVAADSHELAASALRIHVLRSPDRPAPIAPAAIFEPAAAEMGMGPDIDAGPAPRKAAKPDRNKRPASPVKKPASQPEWPTATSAWVSSEPSALPPISFAPTPSWAPFNDR